MALPTRPSGGSSPNPRREPAPQKRESDALPSLPEVSLPAAPRPPQETVHAAAPRPQAQQEPVREARKTKRAPRKPEPKVTETPDTEDDGWAVDRRTGKRYKKLPKTVMGDDGWPLLQVEDFNLDDLTGEAETFLAHLRVPPDREEQKRLRELKAKMAKKQNDEYIKEHKDDEEDEGPGDLYS